MVSLRNINKWSDVAQNPYKYPQFQLPFQTNSKQHNFFDHFTSGFLKAMASIGATCAGVYVMQTRQIEKLEAKRKENNSSTEEAKVVSGGGKNKNKVHPGNFPASETTKNSGEAS